ncbi:basic-leucine zipper transcription factor [Phycomyces blakesleeanus]|uniref:Basic-leucine zipper transcription factor n=2 Tax=Phycomyces blakesleeanus TaxID=4837 RepID=A0A167KX15_PHYB8|nr:basic-leucine zipper transcription factor [Phycomyces blakesleeanus NRRL 1555(-)]OAD69078.1 basic-leucine zipper transcription factor [Phycomyces blakesleeanus NRRL 1555(-)]|eukprot:XP_018287118.1 basic-leucine zipper transcription factor [Phycomyces blakesleeanus NRRL 1555(-)]
MNDQRDVRDNQLDGAHNTNVCLFPPLGQDASIQPNTSLMIFTEDVDHDHDYDSHGLHHSHQDSQSVSPHTIKSGTDPDFLWDNVKTFSIPHESDQDYTNSSPNEMPKNDFYETRPQTDFDRASRVPGSVPVVVDSTSFNISWGGNDTPPVDLHPQEEPETVVSTRPLPKPRGIRKLPEPEPGEDGMLDEDTLKRRKNASAARRSRMKKLLKIEHLEHRVNQLQAENAKLVLSNALLESDKRSMCAKEAEYKKRIKYYEDLTKMHGGQLSNSPNGGQEQTQ